MKCKTLSTCTHYYTNRSHGSDYGRGHGHLHNYSLQNYTITITQLNKNTFIKFNYYTFILQHVHSGYKNIHTL